MISYFCSKLTIMQYLGVETSVILVFMSELVDCVFLCDNYFVNQAFMEETKFAVHLSLPAILIKVKSKNCVNFARCIYQLLNTRMCALVSYLMIFSMYVHVLGFNE